MSDPVEAVRAAIVSVYGVGQFGRVERMLDAFEAAIRAESAGTHDDAWSDGYDEGFAASKRLCEALSRSESAGTHGDGDSCTGIHCGNPEHGWAESAGTLDVEAVAGALYETDPPESWMRTGTDEYRKRARAMLDIWENDARIRAESAGTHRMNSATLKCVVDGETWPCSRARSESAGTPHYPSCNDRCIHYLLGDESVRDEMLPVFSDENPVAVGCQSRQGVVTDSSLESAGTGLDVERLARAMDHADPSISDEDTEMDREEHRAYAREIAAEYARLSSSDTER